MRLKYFTLILLAATALALCYTWQQIEVIRLAYQQNRKNKTYKELLDSNYYLRYNLVNLKSSSHLGNILLAENTVFEIPRESQVRRLLLPKSIAAFTSATREQAGQSENKKPFFLSFAEKGIIKSAFNKIQDAWPLAAIDAYLSRQAQAQDIKNRRE